MCADSFGPLKVISNPLSSKVYRLESLRTTKQSDLRLWSGACTHTHVILSFYIERYFISSSPPLSASRQDALKTNRPADMQHMSEHKNAGDFVRTAPRRPDSHPFPNINKDRQRNQYFENHKVTSGKLIRTAKNPLGRRLPRTAECPQTF